VAHRYHARSLLLAASLLMMATGLAFSAVTRLLASADRRVPRMLNPSSGDVSVFLPLEQAMLAHAASPTNRSLLFARYSLFAGLAGASVRRQPDSRLRGRTGRHTRFAMQCMFWLYAALGLLILLLYRNLDPAAGMEAAAPAQPLRESRNTVYRSRGVVQPRLLCRRVCRPIAAGAVARAAARARSRDDCDDILLDRLLAAFSQLASARLAQRIGLVNTMVYTHLPANIFLVAVPFMPTLESALACLMIRSALSQMDVPARTSYVMAVVSPAERAAAASVTAVRAALLRP